MGGDAHTAMLTLARPSRAEYAEVLSAEALGFVAELCQRFAGQVTELLTRREQVQAQLDAGESLDFLPETRAVREGTWSVRPAPADLQDRRVEITGPVDQKMIINALNSGAQVFMADFEDATAPSWDNLVAGQDNLRRAVRRALRFTDPQTGKDYRLAERTATLMVRPRGWHLQEGHALYDDPRSAALRPTGGAPVPAALWDFGLYFFHNAAELAARGTGPYFYLPKLEHHLEARLWNEVFVYAQERLGLPLGTIKATVLIETLPAAFQMDEILYELRDHSAGLNCGRWDYIFSYIKKLRQDPGRVLPDRGQVVMTQPFLRAYTQLLVKTCHRRGAHAMGGMAAQIPIRSDPERNRAALDKVRADKLREVQDGHDGTWVAHPGLVPVAREVFDAHMKGPNQLDRLREDVQVSAADLLAPPTGTRTEEGLRLNLRVGVQYVEAWLGGLGCVPLYYLMEDAATAEISRAQVWQWLRHAALLDDGRPVTEALFQGLLEEELARVRDEVGAARFEQGHFPQARALFERLCTSSSFVDFLTLPAYELLLRDENITAALRASR